MYRALMRFADLNDGNRIYEAGEQYPRPGLNVTPERIASLAGRDNRMGYPLIGRVIESEEVEVSIKAPTKKAKSKNKG